MLDEHGILATVELATFVPLLFVAIYVCIRQGFKMDRGWVYLMVLSTIRTAGASCLLASQSLHNPPQALGRTYAATLLFASATLLLALLGFTQRLATSMEHRGPPARLFWYIDLATLADLILAIIGVVIAMDDPKATSETSKKLREASGMLFLVVFILLAAAIFWALIGHSWVPLSEKRLLHATAASLPFLLVRIVYNVLVVYSNVGDALYWRDIDIFAKAFMGFLMEVVVVAIYSRAGFGVPRMEAKAEAIVGDSEDGESGTIRQRRDQGRVERMEIGRAKDSQTSQD